MKRVRSGRGGPYCRVRMQGLVHGVNVAYILQRHKLKLDPQAEVCLDPTSPIRVRNVPMALLRDALNMGDVCHLLADWANEMELRELARAPQHLKGCWRTHVRTILSFPRHLRPSSEEIWSLVDPFLDKNFPDAVAIAAIHRERGHVHVHIHILARQRNGLKLDLRGRAFTSIDETWNTIFCNWSGYDPQIQLGKKKETRRFWKRVARQMARDEKAGRPRALQEVIRSLGGKPLRHDDYRTIPLREMRAVNRAANQLERIQSELLRRSHDHGDATCHDALHERAVGLRSQLYIRVRPFVTRPECHDQVLRLVGPSEWGQIKQALGPEVDLAPEIREILEQLRRSQESDPLVARWRQVARERAAIRRRSDLYPPEVWNAIQTLSNLYSEGSDAWRRYCDLADQYGVEEAIGQVRDDPGVLGNLHRTTGPPWRRHDPLAAAKAGVRSFLLRLQIAWRIQARERQLEAAYERLGREMATRMDVKTSLRRVAALAPSMRATLEAFLGVREPELARIVRHLQEHYAHARPLRRRSGPELPSGEWAR